MTIFAIVVISIITVLFLVITAMWLVLVSSA